MTLPTPTIKFQQVEDKDGVKHLINLDQVTRITQGKTNDGSEVVIIKFIDDYYITLDGSLSRMYAKYPEIARVSYT